MGSDASGALDTGWLQETRREKFARKAKQLAIETKVLDAAIALIGALELFNGFGNPDSGFDFTSGKMKFEEYSEALVRANRDSAYWGDGESAEAYDAANQKLFDQSGEMQRLDAEMQALVEKQGQEVYEVRLIIAYTLVGLTGCLPVAVLIYRSGPWGPPLSYIFQTAAALAAIGVAVAYETKTAGESKANAIEADTLAAQYDTVTQAVQPSGTLAAIEVPEALKSTVSNFEAGSDSTSGMSAVADTAGLAGRGARADARALQTGDGDTSGDDAPAETPAFTLPSMSQITEASGQVAEISGHVAQHMNLVNQMMGSAQQLASMAQQGQGAVAPAEEAGAEEAALAGAAPEEATLAGAAAVEAALEGDVEGAGAGAASATEGAERAPIEVATVGPQQGQEPSHVERSV